MLPPFIIEQIRRREEDAAWRDQPRLELPVDAFPPRPEADSPRRDEEAEQRGVIILDVLG